MVEKAVMSSRRDDLGFAERLYLGGRISHKHELFKALSKLGYEEAETYSILEFFEWCNKNPKADLMMVTKTMIEYLGMARFLPHTKELTRLSMILGDTRKRKKWK